MAQSNEFEGDDFSNNFFSDLAPLLTLFGEQVTKQFLSMSMGWSDNFLLAMGPLGIITIIVSAIRVGGGKRLKALIGRARESRSIAEQELLSSTSESVCELWSGQQVVRLIGDSEGMSTLLINKNGNLLSLSEASMRGHIELVPRSLRKAPENARNPRLKHEHRALFEELKNLSDAAPNLALNAGNATVSSLELWLLAGLGLILQLLAVAFPGIASYHWNWRKPEAIDYGYPCFVLGTVCLTAGIVICGHIIEGATEERDFAITQKGLDSGFRFMVLQQDRSIGDQHFPPYVIFHTKNNNVLKISRLINESRRLLVVTSTCLAVSGYILQFVGLRALHWSATIIQLGVTVIMSAVRAWVRRGLAADPYTIPTLKGFEISWLTLFLVTEEKKVSELQSNVLEERSNAIRDRFRPTQLASRAWHYLQQPSLTLNLPRRDAFSNTITGIDQAWLFWEIISGHSLSPNTTEQSSPSTEPVFNNLLSRMHGPLEADLQFEIESSHVFGQFIQVSSLSSVNPLHICMQINRGLSTELSTETDRVSKALSKVIEKTLEVLSVPHTVIWRDETMQKYINEQDLTGSATVTWSINVSYSRLGDYDQPLRSQNRLYFKCHGTKGPKFDQSNEPIISWSCADSDLIKAALELSVFTHTVRLGNTSDRPDFSVLSQDHNSRSFRRIIGHVKVGRDSLQDYINSCRDQEWLVGYQDVSQVARDQIFNTQDGVLAQESFLGMFLSSFSDASSGDNSSEQEYELLLRHTHSHTCAVQYAQELFSLFVLSVASRVEKVNGHTSSRFPHRGRKSRQLKNSVFKAIASEVVVKGLAENVEEAYTLIIPAFAKYNLLPTEPSPQDETASGDPTAPTRAASSEDPTLQGAGVQHSSPPGQPSAPRQDPTPQQPSTQQSATVHQETSREQGSPIHRHPSRQSQCSEPGAAPPSEETSAQPTQAVISRPSSVRRSSY